ncbi:hypothetical protein BLS_008967 [Venturia inaequalis]|uniref:Uncharacterized protein n=1 Tax=Venturia inaequalis TaxID=5025 RepID=A0A8H3U646_VENIN|nr:hypothetical protein BLS_008967 [Venturia inaequalis]KAE9963862.1 hypothetical protein EG328_010971 [Venturia inaequalis]
MPLKGGLYTSGRTEGISQATLDLPYRVYTTQDFSLPSINGSTLVVVGHSNGLTIIWRGGRRFSEQPSDLLPYEPAEEDVRFSPAFQQPIVHRLDIHLSVAVTSLSLCPLPPSDDSDDEDEPPIIIAAACSDYKIRVLKVPSTPIAGEDECDVGSIPTAIILSRGRPISTSIKWTRKEGQGPEEDTGSASRDLDLLVAACSEGAFGKLSVTRIPADFVSQASKPFHPFLSQILKRPARKVSFSPYLYPSPHHTEILVCFSRGSVSIFDPFTATSEDSDPGAWLVTLTPGFTLPLEPVDDAPDTVQRLQILDAEWVAGGQGVMVLLENRQWGIWDRYDISDRSFDFTGFLKWSRAGTRIAKTQNPLGPLNRYRLELSLREIEAPAEAPKSNGPSRGGLTVTPFRTPLPRGYDEWICIWFNDAVYTIPNLRELREARPNFLDVREYAGFNPLGQKVSGAHMVLSFDPVCVRYDLVISTDTRLHLCAPEPTRLDIVNAREEASKRDEMRENRATARANRALLAQGVLDLGGIDKTLDSMAASTTLLSESSSANKAKGRGGDSVQMVSTPVKKLSWGKNKSKDFFKDESLGESESRARGRDKGKGKMEFF